MVSSLLFLLLGAFLYFIPALNAYSRRHHDLPAIIALNALLGWTVLGWILAFVWSFTSNPNPQPAPPVQLTGWRKQ